MTLSSTPEYKIWDNIKQRCLNPNHPAFKDYGGRGISIHPSWALSFAEFRANLVATIGLRPVGAFTLDRTNNSAGYVPGNLRWATQAQQCSNKRNSSPTSNRVQFECDEAWRRQVKAYSALNGVSISAVCVEAISLYLELHPSQGIVIEHRETFGGKRS